MTDEPTELSEEDRMETKCRWIVGCNEPAQPDSDFCAYHEEQVDALRSRRESDAAIAEQATVLDEDTETIVAPYPSCCDQCAGHRVAADKWELSDEGRLIPADEVPAEA